MVVDPVARSLTVVICTFAGLIFGSFLNVVIYRVPRHRSVVRPGSACPQCGTPLSGWENVPVLSWAALRGRCRHCGAPISLRYPLVELLTAGSFAALAACVGARAALVPLLMVVVASVAAAAIDYDGFPVPVPVAATSLVGAAGLVVVSLTEHEPGRLGWAAAGALGTAVLGWSGALLLARRPMASGRLGSMLALGWAAGWLWPPGGFIAAGWAAAYLFTGTPSDATPRHGPRRWAFVAFVGGAFALVVAGAGLNAT